MSKKITIAVTPPVLLPTNLVHYGTEYKVSKSISFRPEDLLVNEISTDNLFEKKFVLDIADDDTFYVVTRYQYIVVDALGEPVLDVDNNPTYKMGTPSMVTPFKGDQEGIKISDTIIKTPTVNANVSYEYNVNGNIVLTTSDFEMFSGIGKHGATTWVVRDLNNNTKYIRERDVDNLTSIVLPMSFNLTDDLLFYAMHHSDTNADSNYGMKFNINSNKLPKYKIEMYGDLYVGMDAQFRVLLSNYLFTNVKIEVIENNVVIKTYNSNRETNILPTGDLVIGKTYTFKFTLTSNNEVESIYTITKEAKDYNSKFNTKTYLDVYDYSGMVITNGSTSTLSYQLDNGAILLCRNNTKNISLAKYKDGNIHFVSDIITLPLNSNIFEPSTFVKELLNGDVIISYVSSDISTFGKTFVNTYEQNKFNNFFKLKNSIQINTNGTLVMPGSITTSGDFVYYIQYSTTGNKLIKLNPYNGVKTIYALPVNTKYSLSLVSDLSGNIYILGGTDDDLENYTVMHKRTNHKVYSFNITSEIFTEVGSDVLISVDEFIYQFHSVLRLDGNITLYNNVDNNNMDIIANQATYVLNVNQNAVTYMDNDHLDSLPYGNTVVLKTGDVIRYSSIDNNAQKVYTYVTNTMNLTDIDDNNTLSYNPLNLVISANETVPKNELCRYDSVVIEPGGTLVLVTEKGTENLYSDTLVVTRDLVMDNADFIANGYSNIVLACEDVNLVLK